MLRSLVMTTSHRTAGAILQLSFLLLAPRFSSPREEASPTLVGTVIELRGNWRIEGHGERLRAGQGVPAGGIVRPESIASEVSISIALLNGRYLAMHCQGANDIGCAHGLQIPTAYIEEGSGIPSMVRTVMNVLLERSPTEGNPFSSTIIRAGQESHRWELVIQVEQGKPARLDAVVSRIPAAEYTCEWSKVTGANASEQKPIRWDTQSGGPLLPIPVSGLYSVRFINEYREPVLDLALLATPSDSYPAINASFEHARRICADWSGPDAADSAHEFLRAYLISLAGKR
jgi:hypothetical protein